VIIVVTYYILLFLPTILYSIYTADGCDFRPHRPIYFSIINNCIQLIFRFLLLNLGDALAYVLTILRSATLQSFYDLHSVIRLVLSYLYILLVSCFADALAFLYKSCRLRDFLF